MSERDARRAQSEALHRAGQEIGDERLATRMDQAMRRFLAGTYYVTLSRGTRRRQATKTHVATPEIAHPRRADRHCPHAEKDKGASSVCGSGDNEHSMPKDPR